MDVGRKVMGRAEMAWMGRRRGSMGGVVIYVESMEEVRQGREV